jgi:para-nitrobenzyl esterase
MTDQPIVTTTTGTLRGRAEDGLLAFRGIPYAAAPAGAARWRAARPHPGWTGVRDAIGYGPSAPQPWLPGGSPVIGTHGDRPFAEDCLTLNLWTPDLDAARRPVLVWIHGGGFLTGSGNMPAYATDTFARDGDLVGISINYRLGPLGFLAGAGDENVWLTDQVAALQWIAGNVAAFGGDPDRITLAGQSGGAFSIAALAQHPGARDLFQRGILQSPPLGLELPTAEDAATRTRALARHLGHSSIGALRSEPWENLIVGTIGVLAEYAEFGEWSLAYRPVIDDATMPRHPIEALTDTSLEMIIGWTRDEASFAFALDPRYAETTSEQVTAWAAKRHPGRAEDLYHAYAATHPGRGPAGVLSQIVTDELFRCGGLRVAGQRARTWPVRVYQFEVTSPLAAGALGATHCLDLPFTFANMNRWASAPFIQGLRKGVIGRVTGALHDAWIAFARHGDPSHPGIPPWEPYDSDGHAVLVIADDETRVVPGLPVPDACAGE